MTTPNYERMVAAIADCHANMQFIDALALEDCLRVANNLSSECLASEIRQRAEQCYTVLLRDAAGLPPKNKRDAAWLARRIGGAP